MHKNIYKIYTKFIFYTFFVCIFIQITQMINRSTLSILSIIFGIQCNFGNIKSCNTIKILLWKYWNSEQMLTISEQLMNSSKLVKYFDIFWYSNTICTLIWCCKSWMKYHNNIQYSLQIFTPSFPSYFMVSNIKLGRKFT